MCVPENFEDLINLTEDPEYSGDFPETVDYRLIRKPVNIESRHKPVRPVYAEHAESTFDEDYHFDIEPGWLQSNEQSLDSSKTGATVVLIGLLIWLLFVPPESLVLSWMGWVIVLALLVYKLPDDVWDHSTS